ncbi:flagellar filament core protein flaB2 domain protein [Leptospira sp. 2 VSF19]|uniref:Flagellar filament core protein flaB2 domain protein n=1 Tax=Leptospira soteropolitanensis TaxID=2950025 RepID=A0AAW5VJ12_9LEPT|nr:flagellar filament core protein flaB2 domain protein [Leptospira soteropolitanensis]MCW7493534.1 flagellar filament core protein flaB2 domain protein [Leptospira soteropolitanensis]MCW7500934.1 flagellar filament core protein flaB2 domain protein [Leptospira soteropolitanensis]MCW7523386.1 flagellar filament core protein flaB2 domain protein [Leptospira soteropolitanensis]MCW7527247.1 flagellar filament core protein flaB2 domain protein [Leptospira soteropolitanensis]MCW7531104.1 flagellar 
MKLIYNLKLSLSSFREYIIYKQILYTQKKISRFVVNRFDLKSENIVNFRTDTNPNSAFTVKVDKKNSQSLESRLKFMAITAKSLERLYQIQPQKTTFQKQNLLIQKTLVYLDTLLAISHRLSFLFQSNDTNQELQGEVQALVDEVDRIASTAKFNRMKLFEGDFAKSSRTASMWFINEKNGELFRMYISTMTSHSLGLTSFNGFPLTLSNPIQAQKKIEVAINRISEERKRIQSVLD